MDKGLPKSYKDEEYAYGLFLPQMAAAKPNDNQNKTPPSNTLPGFDSLKSQTFHNNITNTMDKGLPKSYKDEEYAYGLFLPQMAAAKLNDNQNKTPPSNSLPGFDSLKSQTFHNNITNTMDKGLPKSYKDEEYAYGLFFPQRAAAKLNDNQNKTPPSNTLPGFDSLKSQTFHNNITNTMDKGLPKSYKDEEYAYGLFFPQRAAAKLNDNQNKTPPSNTLPGFNTLKSKYCSLKEIVQHNEKCQPETRIKCVIDESIGNIDAIKFSEKDDSQKSSESEATSAAARSIIKKIHVRKQTLTKRKIYTDVFDEAKIIKYDHSKQMNLQLARSKSQTFHNNITYTMDKGLPKSYKDEEYAYGLFFPKRPETRIKCVIDKSIGKYSLVNVSGGIFQCKRCKQYFPGLLAFEKHLIIWKTTNSTTTQDSAQYGNKDKKKLSDGHENVSLKDRIINTHKLTPRLLSEPKNKKINKAEAEIDKEVDIAKETTNSISDINQNPKALSNLDTLALVATKILLKEKEELAKSSKY